MIAEGVGGGAGFRGGNLTEGCSKSEGGWRPDRRGDSRDAGTLNRYSDCIMKNIEQYVEAR
jgi:hypothetical protein